MTEGEEEVEEEMRRGRGTGMERDQKRESEIGVSECR